MFKNRCFSAIALLFSAYSVTYTCVFAFVLWGQYMKTYEIWNVVHLEGGNFLCYSQISPYIVLD